MNFCRSLYRRWFVSKRKEGRKHEKKLRLGSVHNLLTSSLQKILLSAAGISLFATPLFGASQSTITKLGNQTKINYNDTTKTYTITTDLKDGDNAFNAFKSFTLHSNEIANLEFPSDTKNLLNFVRNKINIEGTLNAVRNKKIDGNLYFLSSEGLIVGKSGVINAGAFYAMTPTKGFMDKFIGNEDKLDISRVNAEIGYIVDRKISNHNAAYDYGVTINPYGEIKIEGKINTVNGIGLYAGGFGEDGNKDKKGVYIGSGAVLNSLDADGFSSIVNVEGLSLPQATDIVEDGGSIELVSVQDNTHNSSKILEVLTGYTSFTYASAATRIESNGTINSRSDVSLTAYSSNGHVKNIKKNGDKNKFDQVANIADIYSTVVVDGTINAEGDISVTATSDNINELKTPNLTSLALEMSGTVFKKFPLNVDANVLVSKTSSYVNVKKDAKLEADGAIEVAATTNSSVKAGAKTSSFVTNETALSDFNWLPIVATAINISEAKAVVDFDGKATSKLEDETAPVGEEPKKSISIKAESNSSLSAASKAKTTNSRAGAGIAFALGKHENTAILNIGKNAGFEAKHTIELSALATSDNSVTSFSSVGKTSYADPAVSIAIFDSEATANVEGKINVKNQVGTFTFNVVNTIDSDELSADSGITAAQRKWAEASGNVKKAFLNGLYEKLKLSNAIAGAMPAANAAKFSIAGSVAYGGGKHSANINIKPGATIKTTGNLNISSEMNIMDTKYSSTADMACSEEHEGSKFSTSIAFLYNDYDYSSTILIDDSSNPKTEISGKNVSIESTIYQPYRRPEAMYEDLKSAWEKVCEYFDGSTHAALFDKVGRSFDKLFTLVKDPSDMTSAGNAQQAGQVWREVTEAFESLYELIKNEAIVTEDSIVGRLIDSVKAVLEFKEYTNYVNVNVSSSVSTDDAGDDQPFSVSGSVYIGNNTAKSNIYGGKNVIIKSGDAADISINSKADVTTTTMVGGIPVLYANSSASKSAGAAVLVHRNNSEANILMANGATIGGAKTGNIDINTANLFKPIELVMGTSSVSSGFNGMASAIDSKSYSNIRLDDGVNLSGDTIKLDAYNNTEATNIVGALTLTEKKGIGVGLAITLMDKESQVLIQDNDQYWQNIRKSKGLSGSTTSSTKVASITADIVKAVAKTTGTINSVGVAGAVAIDDKSKYDNFSDKVCTVNEFLSGDTIDAGTDYLKYKLLGKIFNIDVSNPAAPPAAPAPAPAPGAPDTSLSLTINGSSAANSIKNTTKVAIENAKINFKGKTKQKLDASAINSAHHLAFAGAAGLMAQGDNGAGKSVGVDGSVAVNKIDNTTETLINKSEITYAKQVNATAINGGESIAAGLGLQIIASSQHSQDTGSGAINGSVNLIENTVSAKVKDTNANSSGSGNITNMAVTSYEEDTQVTGGISAAVGKQKGGVGLSIDVAKITNNLTSEINGGKMTQMKNVEVNALQASTIVNAGIALAVSAGVDQGSFGVSGAGVYSELNNTNSANIKNATINSDAVSVRTQDVRTSDSGVKVYHDNLERNGKEVDFIDKEGKEFYTGLDTATGTTELGQLASGRKGSLLVTAAISGAYGGTAVGLGAAINEIENTYNVNVDKSNITTKKFNANAITHTDAITIGIGASVSSEERKGSGAGSAGWNSIKNEAKVTFSNNTIKSETLDLKSLNDASLVGVGGQFSVSKGYAAIGASVAYNSIENTASSKLYGGSVTGVATNTSKLSVNSENTANIWGVAVSVEAAKNLAIGGTLVVNEIENNATSAVGDSSTNTKIASLKEMNILATDSADIKGLSGAVTASKKVSIGGALTINHINGETTAKLNKTNFNALNSNVRAYSESNNLSLALGCGGAGTFAFDGASVNNDIFRDVYVKVENSTTDNATGTFNSSATAIGNTGSLAAVVLGAGKVSIGAGVSVNRMGGKVQTTFDKNNLKLKDLSAVSFSNQDITTIGIAGSGAGVSISGSIAYNAIQYDTIAEILNSTLISATNNIAVKAISDDTIKNYAGVLSLGIGIPDPAAGGAGVGGGGAGAGAAVAPGAAANRNKFLKIFDAISSGLKSGNDKMGTLSSKMGGVGVGVSISVNKIDGKTNAKVSGGNVTAQAKDANQKVKLNNQIADSDINNKYADSSTISIKGSLADKRKETTKTGLVIDSSSTHTTKSFLASVSGAGKAAVNANVNVNYIGGETNSIFENATVNKGLTGKTAGNVNVNANDYTNTAGFIGNVAFGGNAGIGLSADANKVVRDINAKVSGIKDGSVANNLEVKAISKQGISSVVAGLAASLKIGVAGNVDVAILKSTTKALVENSKISVNSMDVEANHYARAHEIAVAAGIGAGTAGVGAAVVVNNDINTVYAGVASSTINANSGSNGAFKVNSKNDDDFETITGAGGAGMYAGVAGAVAVDYMENNVETTVASSTFGNATNRAGSVEIKSKDLSKQVSKGGSVGIGGYAGVGAVVEVNTLDGQTNTNITNSKIYATNNIDLGASEQRDSEQFAVSVSAGLAGVGANVLVINSGKKLDVNDSGSNDANKDIKSAMNMADSAASSDYLGDNYYKGAFSADEIATIFKGTPSYTASKDGKAITLTKIDKSTIDSKSGKISSLSTATGTLTLSNNGGAAGAGGVMGTFGYIYDNKNVVTTITNSSISANKGIDYTSSTYGNSDLSMFQGSAGLGDYSGAFAYVNLSGKNSLGVAGSTITNATGTINLKSLDYASGKTEASGCMLGGVAVGTIISRAKNNSSTDVTIGKSKITSNASGTINILSEKGNSLEAIGHGYGGGVVGLTVISTLAQDNGSSTVKLDTGNTFKAKELSANANNNPNMKSSYTARSGGGLGVGVGDVTTREYGCSKLIAQSGSRYDVGTVNLGANMSSTSNEESSAHTYSLIDVKANRVDNLSSSKVDVIVNIGKNNYNNNTVLNVSANNKAYAKMSVDGQSGGAISVANSLASATANLTTNVTITGAGDSTKLGEINAASSSEAEHRLYANGDGGGLINVSPYAAEVDSTMNLTTNTKLAGTLSASNTKVAAVGRGKSYTTTHAYQGSITGGSGVQTNTNITANTKVLANDNLKLTGDSIKLVSLNDITTGPESEGRNNNGRAYGGITGNSVIGREKITGTSEVNIGKKASLIADKELKIDAKTKTDLKNKVYSGGAGLGIHIGSEGDYNLTLNNNIITNAGSLLKTEDEDADIYLATSYDFNAYYLTLSEVFGSGGGSTKAHTKYNITTNNKIDLTGDVYSYHDINLLTDRSTDNVKSKYNLSTEAECYTKSVIAWETDPVLEGSLKLNNNINVNSSSTVQSVRHSRFYVDNGDFSYKTHTKRYTWYNDEDKDTKNNSFATVAEGVKNGDVKQNTAIKVDGKVITGVHKDINIKIDGKVSFDKTVSGSGFVNTPTIECSVDEYKNAIKYGTMEYGNKLFERYQELEKLCVEYSGTIVGQNYEAEKIRLQNEMEKYGLYDAKNNSAVGKLSVDYIELPDMISSGGNIYIKGTEAKNINGKGTLKAQGAPKITVENNSNLYMIVNDLKILDPGGDIILNDLELQTKAKETIKGVTNVETDASTGSSIDVKENWESSYDISYKDPDGKQGKITGYTPLTNIEINGDIVNVYGKVNFFNKNKDIVLQGKTAKDSASINGREISISAPKGSIAQGYTQGITNIGYTPEFVLKKFAKANEDAISKGVTSDTTKTDSITLTEADIQKYIDEYKKTPEGINESASGVWLAGGSIFLNGDDINVNGTIQSGYSQFEVTLTNSNKSRINAIKSQYQKDHKPEVTDSYLSEYCKINTSGMMWDNNEKAYKYVVQAYYNPQTDQIILEDVKSEGGKIYLTGRISNTSGGKIFAADGSSDINITNKTGINLVAKTLDAGDRKGLISITDLGKNKDDKGNKILGTLTEITSDSTKVWYLTSKGKNVNPDKTSGSISSYTPSLGLTYNWSTGYDTLDEFRYDTSYKFLFWGLIDYGEETKATLEYKKEHNEITPKHLDNKSKLAGTFIGTPDGVDSKKGYFVYFNKDGKYKNGPITGGYTDYNTFFHASGTQYQWAIMKEGSTEIYQHSIKADYPIAIKFLTGKGLINVDTNSNLTLSSDITSKNGKVNLISKGGSIEQLGGTITTDKLTMEASTGIGANKAITQQMNSKDGVLSATTNSGDINLISLNQAGLKDAALKFTATTNKGNVNVVADASLLKGNNALDVKGSRIDLVSNYGSLGDGAHNEYLNIYAGQVLAKPGDTLSASVNASALGDIALNQDSGNMRIGKIVSKTGDVYLTSDGAILDALPPSGTEVQSQSSERLIEKWKQMGIISDDGQDNAEEKRSDALDAYKQIMSVSFQRYLDLKTYFDKNKETTSEQYSEYQKLKEKFGKYTTFKEWLNAQNNDKSSDLYKLKNDTLFGWDQDSLLYAIQDSIINREEGSTITPKSADDANIKARNVFIKAGGGIGRDEGYTVVDISNFTSAEGLEVLKKIAAAEASDVKWGYEGDKVNKDKATINNINSIAIDAKGTLEAYAKGNIYLEDVNNNEINLISVSSEDGNVRVYGNNGIYNATEYVEGNKNNTINLAGKDLIIEGGSGSIGSSTVPVTTNMTGYITARSEGLINLYQIGGYAMTFAAGYAGADINIRSIASIYSVYNGNSSDELGYINAKGNITLLSDKGNIGQANGKGLRVKLAEGQLLNAEADSIYIKGYGDNKKINLGQFKARKGDIGLESKLWDVFLKNDISANNIELIVRSLTQLSGSLSVNKMLKVIADNGIMLTNSTNMIPEAYLLNNKSGGVTLNTNTDLTLYRAENNAEKAPLVIFAKGAVNALEGLLSMGSIFVWSNGDITSNKEILAEEWLGLYADNGGINVKTLSANAIELVADKNGLTTDRIDSDTYIKANVQSGDIKTSDVIARDGSIELVTEAGSIKSNTINATDEIKVAAYFGDSLEFKTINSKNGAVEAVSFGSLTGDSIVAGKEFYVGALKDLKLNTLISGSSDENVPSYLIGYNLEIDTIKVDNDFESVSDYLKVNKVEISNNANIDAYYDVEIDNINVGENLDISSFEKGNISINKAYTESGIVDIYNDSGITEINDLDAGNDVYILNTGNSDTAIYSLNTRNKGSLYANLENGEFHLMNAYIDGEASIYSEEGYIGLTSVDINDELDIRAKYGSIAVSYGINIGGDATFKSDNYNIGLEDAVVGGNLKISAKTQSYIHDAIVNGSMLMKGDEDGCVANSLEVGKDLILTSQTGSITLENAKVGEDTYVSIEGNGGNIDITDIHTGTDKTGDLIVSSNSVGETDFNDKFVDIEKAYAANKLIINSLGKVILQYAYAYNGRLEVKAAGDIYAKLLQAAKDTYLATVIGEMTIVHLISGDSISVNSFGGKINIEEIETLNPEADISILQAFGDLKISNASSARDLEFTCIKGSVELNKVSTARDINIKGESFLGDGAKITINNSLAGNDINLDGGAGDVVLTGTNIGNNLNVSLDGNMNVSDVQVGNYSNITTYNNSYAKFNSFKSNTFDLTDNGNSSLFMDNSIINKANILLGGNAKFSNSHIDNLTLEANNGAIIDKSTIDKMIAKINGESSISESKFDTVDLVNLGNTQIVKSSINSISANNSGSLKLSETENTIKQFDLTNSGETTIEKTNIDKFSASNENDKSKISLSDNEKIGAFDLTNNGETTINKTNIDSFVVSNNGKLIVSNNNKIGNIDLNNVGEAAFDTTNVGKITADNEGSLSLADKMSVTTFSLNNSGKTTVKESNIGSLNTTNSGEISIAASKVNVLTAINSGEFKVDDLTSDNLQLTNSSKAVIDNSNIKVANVNNSDNTEINNSKINTLVSDNNKDLNITKLTSDNTNIKNTGNLNILDSYIATFKGSNTNIANIKSSKINTFDYSNDAKLSLEKDTINNVSLTGKGNLNVDSSDIESMKATQNNIDIKESTIDNAELNSSGNIIANNLTSVNTIANADGNFELSNSKIDKLNGNIKGEFTADTLTNGELIVTVGGNATINNLTGNKSAQLSIGNDAIITESSIEALKASVNGNAEIKKLTNKSSDLTVGKDATITSSQMSKVNAKIGGNANISELTSDNVTTQIGGNASLTDSKVGILNSKITGDTTIKNVENTELTADIGGKVEIEKLTGNKSSKLTVGKDASIIDSGIEKLEAEVKGNTTVNNLVNSQLTATVGGNANINNLTGNKSTNLTIGKDANITNSSIYALMAKVGGNVGIDRLTDNNSSKLTVTNDGKITNSNIANLDASIGGKATIDKLSGNKSTNLTAGKDANFTNSSINTLTATVKGNATIDKLTDNNSSKLTITKDGKITNSNIDNLDASIGGNAIINNVVNSQLAANIGGNATINNLTGNKSAQMSIGNDAFITESTIDVLKASVNGNAEIKNLTNKSSDLTVGKDATITSSQIDKLNAKVGGNANISELTSDNVTTQIGGNATLTDSKVGILNSKITGDTTINNVENTELTADIGGNATINKVTGNKSTNLTTGKDATITNSSINALTATAKGNATIDKLTDNNSSKLTVTKDGKITNSNIAKLDASIGGNANINNVVNSQLTANVGGNATINKLTGNKSTTLTTGKDATITNSSINTLTATAKGNATIDKLTDNNSSKLTLTKDGKITNSNITKLDASIGGNANINNIVNSQLTANVGGNATINKLTGNKSTTLTTGKDATITNSSINTLSATAKGNATIDKLSNNNSSDLTVGKNVVITNSDIIKLKAIIGGNSAINKSTFDQINTKVTGNASIATSTVNTMTAVVDGTMTITETPITLLDLNTKKGAIITRSEIDEMKAVIDGNSSITNSLFKKVNLTNKGKAVINKTTLNNITTNNSGNLNITDSTANSFALTNSGNTDISKSKVNALTGNNSGSLTVKNTPVNTVDVTTSGKLSFDRVDTSKLKLNNSGTALIKDVSVNGAGYITNNKGNVNIESFNVSKNFDMDSKSGNIYMNNIDINKDFNFALSGDSKVSFGEIVIGENFNVYAGKASIKGTGLWVGENMNTYTYSKYSAPKLSLRAAVSANTNKNIRANTDEGFILVLDELNIGGGLYVDNPDVTIKVKDSYVGHDVNIDAGKENIQIDNLDVDGGSLNIKGDSGSIKLGEIKVENFSNINLGSGDLNVSDLTSKLDIDFNVGGNITSDKNLKSENSYINVVSGGNLTANSVEAKSKIDFNAGGNISSDQNIETMTDSVNMIAGGSVNAYKILAKDQGNIEAVRGDIIIGQIDGKTLIFKEDTNDRTLRIREANVESKITAGADYIDIDLINHTSDDDRLPIDFSRVNGRAMDNVVIRDVKTNTGVNMFNLVSTYANIHVSNEIFNLYKTYLLKKGDLSNTILKFRLYGDNPIYSKDVNIIAFFAPMINHKSFADISFTNEWHPERQDYYPLTAKGDYRRMFNQYTVVQDFETLRLAYEDMINDINSDIHGIFAFREIDNSRLFHLYPTSEVYTEGESINLENIDIPVGVEFDSAKNELRSVGSYVKPQSAE